MLSLALSVAVLSSQGGLLAEYQPRHLRLIDAAEVIGSSVASQAGYAPVPMTPDAIRAQIADLEENMPTLVMPIVFLSIGVGVGLTSSIIWSAVYIFDTAVYLLLGAGVVVGIVFTIIGVVTLINRIVGRARTQREINRLEAQLNQAGPGAPTGNDTYQPLPTSPAPPPPPPTSQFDGPGAGVMVAEF